MKRYPIRASDVINQKDVDTGRTNLTYHYMNYIHRVNAAFYDGFLLAMCESREDFQSITTIDRICACIAAELKMNQFLGAEPQNKEDVSQASVAAEV